MEIKGKDYIHGDDEDIIAEMKQVEAELNDRIDEVRSTANTAGLDPALARTLYDRLNQATTHLSSGADTAMHNINAARERMAIAEQGAGRVNSINTSIGSGPAMPQAVTQGRNYASGISQHQQVRPTGVQRTRQAGPVSAGRGPAPQQVTQPRPTEQYTPQPAQTRTSAGGYTPQAPTTPQPAPRVDHTIPSTPMRNGAFVPPVPSGMPNDYAARLAERQAQAQQAQQSQQAREQQRAAQQQAREQQRARLDAQRAQQQELLAEKQAEREAAMEKRTAELEKQREEQQQALADKQAEREAAREQAVREAEERAAEREAEREAKVAKAERDERLQEVLKEWRNEVSQMDAEHQEQVLDEAGDTVSREEAVKIIEEALGDYYANEAPAADGGVDPVAADGGAYAGGGGLAPAGSIGMAEGDVSFANVNMGVMDEATAHAYIEDALDLNGWTTDPNVRSQVHNLMYMQMMHESGGNTNAANGWDSNSIGPVQSDGFPYQSSRGPWQTIPQTFAAYHVEGTSNSIYDPQASAAAALAYMMDRYGFDPQTGAGVAEFGARRGIDVNTGRSSGAYIGY